MIETEEKSSYLASFAEFERNPGARSQNWLDPLRRSAIAHFGELGFPSTREEEWRFTSVSPIARTTFRLPMPGCDGLTVSDLSNYTFGEVETQQLVFVDGRYCESLSTLKPMPKGMRITSLAAAMGTDRGLVEPHLARYADAKRDAFAALNTAFIADGAFVYLPPGSSTQAVVHLLFLATRRAEPIVSYPRNLIVIGKSSRATIVESYVGLDGGTYFTNSVTEIAVGDNSVVDHYKLQRESKEAYHIGHLHVHQERDSTFSSHSLSFGGALVRNDVHVVLDAEGAECDLSGLYVTRGHQHIDNHTSIDHAKPHCSSRELYKGILDDSATGVFTGRIIVRKDAQKTNAKQTNKNLLLSEEALVDTMPQLEIYADDVKCTHGATIGQIDEEGLFYLRSRGLDESAARMLLTYAFATEILSAVKVKPIQCQIDLFLLTLLSRLHP